MLLDLAQSTLLKGTFKSEFFRLLFGFRVIINKYRDNVTINVGALYTLHSLSYSVT